MDLSACVTDEDYEAWRSVRIAVVPGERCPSVTELRAQDSPARLMLLARRDGVVVGSGLAGRSDVADAGFAAPRVLPERRRTGIGSALLHAMADHCVRLGLPVLRGRVDDAGSLAFADRHGFAEVDREIEQVRTVGAEAPPPAPPDGVEVVTVADRPELWVDCYQRFGAEVLADFALHVPLEVSAEQWSTTWRGDPMFLALHDGDVIGCAGLLLDQEHSDRAENALTGVRRDWRGRGIASLLKRHTLHWAATHGLRQVYTWTQAGNASMAGLNEHLGYVTTRTSVTVSRPLPLTT